MGTRQVESVWVICRAYRRHELASDADGSAWRFECRCGSTDYSLTVNDPAKPVRLAMHDSGPKSADVRLPDDPPISEEALKAGRYP